MASTYSTSLKLQLMATGENTGTWGNVTNVNLGTALEEAIVGSVNVTFSSADVTLTLTDTNAAQTARNMRLVLTGTSGGARQLVVPAVEKIYIVKNDLADTCTVKVSGQTGVAVPTGKTMWLCNDGTDVKDVVTHLSSLTLGSALPIASGGTGSNSGVNVETVLVTGVLPASKGGTGLSTFTAGTDYVAPNVATNFTALQTFTGASSTTAMKLLNVKEAVTISATAATGTINYDITTQSVLYYTTNASANWTVNFRASSGTSLNSVMSNGESISVAFLVTQGSTAYYNNVVQVDSSSVTPKWQGGSAPSSGNVNGVDIYTYTIIKTATSTFTVFASQIQFA
jgi:hypothetical protein